MYKLTHTDSVVRIADGAFIPADPANTDYQAFMAWKAEGNTPEPASSPSKSEKIATLTAQYKADVSAMQLSWLAASVTGGTGEAAKKAAITQDLADLKTQYTSDLTTIRNS